MELRIYTGADQPGPTECLGPHAYRTANYCRCGDPHCPAVADFEFALFALLGELGDRRSDHLEGTPHGSPTTLGVRADEI